MAARAVLYLTSLGVCLFTIYLTARSLLVTQSETTVYLMLAEAGILHGLLELFHRAIHRKRHYQETPDRRRSLRLIVPHKTRIKLYVSGSKGLREVNGQVVNYSQGSLGIYIEDRLTVANGEELVVVSVPRNRRILPSICKRSAVQMQIESVSGKYCVMHYTASTKIVGLGLLDAEAMTKRRAKRSHTARSGVVH